MSYKLLAVASLFVLGVLSRIFPHPPNLTAITALPFGGAWIDTKHAGIVMFIAMAVTDLMIGLYDLRILASVYLSLGVTSLIAHSAANQTISWRILGAALASIVFFLITNAAVWAFSPWYEKSFEGLMYSYTLGLPFLTNMLTGNMLYTVLISGLLHSVAVLERKQLGALSAQAG